MRNLGVQWLFFLRTKEMPPAWRPKASLEEPQKGPGDGEIWNLITRGSLSHALTLGK